MHEGPVLPRKWMAIASVDRSTSGSADMGEKQSGLYMCRKRAQIAVIPGWQDIFK
jgi:hypothetical protein